MRRIKQALVKDTKANHYNNAISQCNKDPKSMWKTINQLKNKKSKTTKINELVIDQKVATNPDAIAEGMNEYFNDIGTVLADNLSNGHNSFEAYVNPTETTFEIQNISVMEVKSEISRIKTSKATRDMIVYHQNF